MNWSDLRRWRRYPESDIPVLGLSSLSYGDYDNSGVEERSNFRSIQRDFPDTAESDSVWWEVRGGYDSHALVLRLPPTIPRWMEFVAGQKVHANHSLRERFPFSTSNERDAEVWGARISAALIARMWSRNGHNMDSDQWDHAADALETLGDHYIYDEDDSSRLEMEMIEEAWTDWGWDDFKRDLTDARRNLLPALWTDHLLECLDTVLDTVTDPGGVLAWLTADGDLDHGIEGGGNVYFRWETRLTEVWEQFEDHGTLPWEPTDKPDTTDPAQLTLEVTE